MSNQPSGALDRQSVEGVIAEIERAGDGPQISLADVLDALGARSFAPMLLVPALVAVSPLSGIIGMSSFCGLWIAAIAVQLLLRRDHIWLPAWMQRRSLSRQNVQTAVRKLRGPAHWLDEHKRKRLTFVLRFPFGFIIAAIILSLGLIMPFLEFVPFSGSLAGFTVALLALGLLYNDGIFVLAGLASATGVVALLLFIGRTAVEVIT
ncbi:MAG: exopolysaccharide biosynthesis protein [Pseudomonadota bacterium]